MPEATDKKCIFHTEDPSIVEKARLGKSTGGKSFRGLNLKLTKGKVENSKDVQRVMNEVFENMITGNVRITANQMQAIAALANAYTRVEHQSNTVQDMKIIMKEFEKLKKSREK